MPGALTPGGWWMGMHPPASYIVTALQFLRERERNMIRRTVWPYLQRLYSDKQHEHYDAERAYRESVYRGDPDDSKARWLTALRVELDELAEALVILTAGDRRITFGGVPLIATSILFVVLMIVQVVALVWVIGQ